MRDINSTASWFGFNRGIAAPGAATKATFVAQAAKSPDAVAQVGLRFGTELSTDGLAMQATHGLHTAESLLEIVRPGAGRAPRSAGWDHRALASLALLWCGRGRTERELAAGAEIYTWLESIQGTWAQLPANHHQVAAQAMFLVGRNQELSAMMASLTKLPGVVADYLKVDLLNPTQVESPDNNAWQTWVKALSAPFIEAGLAPLAIPQQEQFGSLHYFDRLSAPDAVAGRATGELVTVIIPCFSPDEGLLTSVDSIIKQTYRNLEIIIVDDASGPAFQDVIAQAEAMDERVSVLQMEHNGGSYIGRRAALALTKGTYVTTQDADDWSHPQRIEHQVAAFTDEAAATRSDAVRAKDDLTHQWLGYPAIRNNASSLMFRRSLLAKIGSFLPLRKGADSEYAERLVALAGPVIDTRTPLAITRLRMGSLSRGDFTYGWSTPDRNAFRGAYRAWHRELLANPEQTPDSTLGDDLPIGVPTSFVRNLPGHPVPRDLDVAVLGDFRTANHKSGIDEAVRNVLAALPAEQRIGVWHQEAFGRAGAKRADMHTAWWDIVQSDSRLSPLTRLTQARVGRLIITDPAALLLLGHADCTVTVGSIEMWLTPAPLEVAAGEPPLDLLAASDVCFDWFGRRPRWVFAPHLSADQREAVAEAMPQLDVSGS